MNWISDTLHGGDKKIRSTLAMLYAGVFSAFSALAFSPMAAAQQEDGDAEADADDAVELGRQVVTGSRIKRIDVEQARPVVVITREEIQLSGQESVADVLRNSPVNTQGSSREQSGSSFVGQATISLHGVGSTRSLVLLDGRRLPRSPTTANQAIDLNVLPLGAVERIEVLTDSASAIYGSDAIAGVINVILRKDYEGLEFSGSAARPTRDGADQESGSISIGGSTNRGRFMFSADFFNKKHIASAHRDYAKGDPGYEAGSIEHPDPPFDATWYDWGNASNVSSWGNTIWPYYLAPPNCEQVTDADGNRLLLGPYRSANEQERCGFDYTAFSWETADYNRISTFLHADYEINPDHAVRLQSMFSTSDAHGRYAPAVGFFAISADAAEGLKQGFDFDIPYPAYVQATLPGWAQGVCGLNGPGYCLGHRFVGLGNRNFEGKNSLLSNSVMAYGRVGMFDYELEASHVRYDFREDSCCYAKSFTAAQYVAQGRYNPFDPLSPDNAAAYDAITANASRDARGDQRLYNGNVSFQMFELPAGPVGWAAGFDYVDEEFYDIYDPLSAGGDLIGSAGNSGEGERAVKALFAESLIPVLYNLEVGAAMRWDSYDDSAGSELSSYLSARYTPTDWLLVRASWGEGFRAANLNNLYGARSISYEFGVDLVDCRRNGVADENCTQQQYGTYSGGNPLVAPELSDSLSVGFVVDWEPFTVRGDYWTVNIDDGIGLSTLQGLINAELNGQCADQGVIDGVNIIECSPGNVLKRDPASGALFEAEAGWGNTFRSRYGGIDLDLEYELETNTAGDFTFGVYAVRMLTQDSRSRTATEWSSGLGEAGNVKLNAQFLLRWQYTDHVVSLYARHLDGYVRLGNDDEVVLEIPSHTEFDLFYQWTTPWDGRLSIGVRNATDEDPELDYFADNAADYSLYGLDGRVPYVSYRHIF